jgi:hypothetical protein
MLNMKLFTRREDPMAQISRRLASIEASHESIRNADPVETYDRLMRLRHGTVGRARRDSDD